MTAAEITKTVKYRAKRRDFKKIVESTTLFCEISVQTCEEFKAQATENVVTAAFDAQVRAYRRVLQMLSGEAK